MQSNPSTTIGSEHRKCLLTTRETPRETLRAQSAFRPTGGATGANGNPNRKPFLRGNISLSSTFLHTVNPTNVKAILRYAGAPAIDPVTSATQGGRALNDADLHVCLFPSACERMLSNEYCSLFSNSSLDVYVLQRMCLLLCLLSCIAGIRTGRSGY